MWHCTCFLSRNDSHKMLLNGSISGLTEFLDTTALPECADLTSGQHTMEESFEKLFFMIHEEWLLSCPLPCNQTIFEVDVQRYHKHNVPRSYSDKSGATGVVLLLKYQDFIVEEQVESLVYSTATFLAQAGGNLGLFLGFSCLTVLLDGINLFEKYFCRCSWEKFCFKTLENTNNEKICVTYHLSH